MYILTHNDTVFLGPMEWRARMFQSVIKDDFNLDVILPTTDPIAAPFGRYEVSPEIVIRPVTFFPDPAYNAKIQGLHGPFYNFTTDQIILFNTVVDLPVEAVKNSLKAIVTSNRYDMETSGISMMLQNTPVFITTARGDRDIYLQSYQLGITNIDWKFSAGRITQSGITTTYPETWLTITNSDLASITQTVLSHVSAAFAWERAKLTEIDNCTTLQQLDAVILTQ